MLGQISPLIVCPCALRTSFCTCTDVLHYVRRHRSLGTVSSGKRGLYLRHGLSGSYLHLSLGIKNIFAHSGGDCTYTHTCIPHSLALVRAGARSPSHQPVGGAPVGPSRSKRHVWYGCTWSAGKGKAPAPVDTCAFAKEKSILAPDRSPSLGGWPGIWASSVHHKLAADSNFQPSRVHASSGKDGLAIIITGVIGPGPSNHPLPLQT